MRPNKHSREPADMVLPIWRAVLMNVKEYGGAAAAEAEVLGKFWLLATIMGIVII